MQTETNGKTLSITPGKWEILDDNFGKSRIGVNVKPGAYTNICTTFNEGHGVEAQDNSKAICTAVNETYGKGYRPETMDELYKALDYLLSSYKADFKNITGADLNDTVAVRRAKQVLSTAKL